jgi:hypothetical protein
MRTLGKLVISGALLFALLQLVRPGIPVKPATAELQAPPEVRHIFDKSCYSCHSDQRRLSWFDQIVPGYWLVRNDILTARQHLNFSTLDSSPPATEKAALYEAVNMIQLGAMPLPRFLLLHPEANVTSKELTTLKAYLAPWTAAPSPPGSAASSADPAPTPLAKVRPVLDGFPFDPTFESWKPISTTDRGDNNSFRFILGNEVAVEAAKSGKISPWPDGASFAKVTWERESGTDGLVHPGKFIQVELMRKNARQYMDTDGWGWGRWRGLDLKPYGRDAHFVAECTGCHRPMHDNDYVYTLPITAARVSGNEVVNNSAAALPASLPYQPLAWNAITMYVDPQARTMATLYGNDAAMQTVQARRAAAAGGPGAPAYQAGTVLALVTWLQRDDPHWFGARIPSIPQSVEFVEMAAAGQTNYRRFAGTPLMEDHSAATAAAQRTSFAIGLAPARLP